MPRMTVEVKVLIKYTDIKQTKKTKIQEICHIEIDIASK